MSECVSMKTEVFWQGLSDLGETILQCRLV